MSPGELYIGTDGIFRIILDKNGKTQRILVTNMYIEVFISNPMHDGDLAHWSPPVSGIPTK